MVTRSLLPCMHLHASHTSHVVLHVRWSLRFPFGPLFALLFSYFLQPFFPIRNTKLLNNLSFDSINQAPNIVTLSFLIIFHLARLTKPLTLWLILVFIFCFIFFLQKISAAFFPPSTLLFFPLLLHHCCLPWSSKFLFISTPNCKEKLFSEPRSLPLLRGALNFR